MEIEPEALKLHGVARHKGGRVGVLEVGGNHFEKADAGGRRHSEMQFAKGAVGCFVEAERDGLQAAQSSRGDDLGPVGRIGGFVAVIGGVGCEPVEDGGEGFEMDPAVDQRAAEAGLVIGVKG